MTNHHSVKKHHSSSVHHSHARKGHECNMISKGAIIGFSIGFAVVATGLVLAILYKLGILFTNNNTHVTPFTTVTPSPTPIPSYLQL